MMDKEKTDTNTKPEEVKKEDITTIDKVENNIITEENGKMKFYTFGYGGRQPDDFIRLLKENGIEIVVDVRLLPNQAYMSFYKKAKSEDKGIQRLLKDNDIQYVSLIELGNIFLNREDGLKPYEQLVEQSGDLLFERLYQVPEQFCLMCAEKKVTECHRYIISNFLVNKGWEVKHIE